MGKKVIICFLIAIGCILCVIFLLGIFIKTPDSGKVLLPIEHKEIFENAQVNEFPSKLSVEDNRIIDDEGNIIILKGIMPPDPAKLHAQDRFNKELFMKISESGANVIRIPVHPENWDKDPDYLWRYLDKVAAWAGELNMYVIIDWHYIGNIETGQSNQENDISVHIKELTKDFWQKTANYFKDAPHVIFEIINEPADITAEVWQFYAEELVQSIRDMGVQQLIIVGGTEFSKDLSWVLEKPINDENIAYTSHIYPIHLEESWDYFFGEVSKQYPVLMTEWGFIDENRYKTKQSYLIGDRKSYGEPLMNYLEDHNIGWVACWFDDTWEPEMYRKGFKEYTNNGKFIMEELGK